MGLSPKTKDRGLTIAGQGRASQQEAVTYVRCGSSATEVVEATPPPLVRFASESGHRERASKCLLRADCVAKVFLAFGRETLIQDRARTSNNDSKEPTLRFDCYKFLFHRVCLATFATQSANSGIARCNNLRGYSITSSASNWIELGTSMPSALAVRTLMTNSNLLDCKTGRSAGFAPLRIRPVEMPT